MDTGAIITAVAALFIKSETNIVNTRITTRTHATFTPDRLLVIKSALAAVRTEHVKASQVLEFRDKAFDTYFKNSDYLSMITKTFGKETTDHINKMTVHKLKRKHNFEEVNY